MGHSTHFLGLWCVLLCASEPWVIEDMALTTKDTRKRPTNTAITAPNAIMSGLQHELFGFAKLGGRLALGPFSLGAGIATLNNNGSRATNGVLTTDVLLKVTQVLVLVTDK